MLPIGSLKPAAYNPRKQLKLGDKEYENIKKSIEEFGYVEPIIVNYDMTVIGGHQRLTVLKNLGYEEVQCVVVHIEDEHKVKALTSTELVSVGPDGRVAVKDAYGSQRELPPFDTLVLALGYRPSNALCAELSLAGVPFTAIGDCRRVGKVLDAMHEAYTAAYNL